jgi:5-oxoprolinase (ATP-hydrolysing)
MKSNYLGGLTPGSMPPNSTKLWQEGAFFKSMKIVENNIFKEEGLKNHLNYEYTLTKFS